MTFLNTEDYIEYEKKGVPSRLKESYDCEKDTPVKPTKGTPDIAMMCSEGYTEKGLTQLFRGRLKYKDSQIERIDAKLNKKTGTSDLVCPSCGAAVNAYGNDGYFCKCCGQRFEREITVDIGNGLKQARLRAGLTLKEAKEVTGVSASSLSKLENNKMKETPDITVIENLASAYGSDLDWVAGIPSVRDNENPEELLENEDGYACPRCKEPMFFSAGEALSIDLETFEDIKDESNGNDGHFCKYCGQPVRRPVEIDYDEMFDSYSFWIKLAAKKIGIN